MQEDEASRAPAPDASGRFERGERSEPRVTGDERFRLLVENVVDYAILLLDLDGNVVSWNAGAQRVKGYLAEEVLGRHFSIFYPGGESARSKCDWELEVAARDGRFEEEGLRVRKDGTMFWANVVITPVRDASGNLLGFGMVARDFTEKRRAEEELRRSEERLRLLIASVSDYAIFILDPTGHVSTWNAGAQRLKGYTAEEIIGRHFSCFYPQSDVLAGKCERELEGAERVGRFEDEGIRIRKDGSQFWANVVITPIRDASGTLIGFAKVTRDLTERREHEEERLTLARSEEARRVAEANEHAARIAAEKLREARDKAEESTRLKDEFLATVSHELRTPLNAIVGWGRMLQTGSLGPDKVTQAIDTIVRNASAQSQIIDDLLDVSRITSGQLRLDVDLVDINRIANAALDAVNPAARAKQITLSRELDPDAGTIRGDAGRLQQVLWNLLSNAVKFTPAGGRVRMVLWREGSALRIEVIDSGKGIAPNFLARVFDRFSQQEGSKARSSGGLGLGLAIVKHLVELHGGTVEAHSDGEGKGATFRVSLPLAAVRFPRIPEGPGGSPPALTYPPELQGLRVLVVDDEPDARELVKEVLERARVIVTLAESSADALAKIAQQKPDLIISDIGMPGEDGYAFMRKLRRLSRDEGGRIPAVALTAFARKEDRHEALMAGFQSHAAKPIDPQNLLILAANLAERHA
ncbi:MAG TPA: PAS domain S-box protein [Polyangiaceae bacterium]|nr:PAS domain S-box protein [Polyangiaceae bacterium]